MMFLKAISYMIMSKQIFHYDRRSNLQLSILMTHTEFFQIRDCFVGGDSQYRTKNIIIPRDLEIFIKAGRIRVVHGELIGLGSELPNKEFLYPGKSLSRLNYLTLLRLNLIVMVQLKQEKVKIVPVHKKEIAMNMLMWAYNFNKNKITRSFMQIYVI